MGRSDDLMDEQPRSLDWADDVRFKPKRDGPQASGAASLQPRKGFGRIAGVAFVVALGVAGVAAANAFGGGDAAPTVTAADKDKRLADLDAELKRRGDALAEIERRHAAKEGALADATERLARLENRKQSLEREIADLVAPVSSPNAPNQAERGAEPDQAMAATAPSDPSPPDEEAELRAPKQANEAEPAAAAPVSTAAVDPKQAAADIVAAQPAGSTRVYIHVRTADPAARERALAVAEELRRRGVAVAEIRGVRYPVRKDAVRYFYDADRAVVETLQKAVRQASAPGDPAPQAQDFRSFRAPPRQGTLELWLS